MRSAGYLLFLAMGALLQASAPKPEAWVPARWPWADEQSLELLAGGPVNCLLLKTYNPGFVTAAAQRGLATLAVINPGDDVDAAIAKALQAKVTGIVLDGLFPESAVAAARKSAGTAPLIELTSRRRLVSQHRAAVIGTYQGVWPGIVIEESGATKAGPTGSVWVDTNTGFLRAIRTINDSVFWMANQPPAKAIITTERYLQVIADAAAAGARWVVALDSDFAARLSRRQPAVMRDWQRILEMLRYFEEHPEWRRMRQYGQIAIIQDPKQGGLLSGGILDMMAASHQPIRPLTRGALTGAALRDVSVAVNLDPGALSPEQQETLRRFSASGGKIFTAPPIWTDDQRDPERFELNKSEFDLLEKLSSKLDALMPPRNSGIRLFNASPMLSNVLVSDDGNTLVLHLVNYSDYPAENITIRFPNEYRKATLIAPDSPARNAEVSTDNGRSSITVEKMRVLVTLVLAR